MGRAGTLCPARLPTVRFALIAGIIPLCRELRVWARFGHFAAYSVTSSARVSSGRGTVRPSVLAVLRLMMSSTLGRRPPAPAALSVSGRHPKTFTRADVALR